MCVLVTDAECVSFVTGTPDGTPADQQPCFAIPYEHTLLGAAGLKYRDQNTEQTVLTTQQEREIAHRAAIRDVLDDMPRTLADGSLDKAIEPFLAAHPNLPYIPVESPEVRANKILSEHGG